MPSETSAPMEQPAKPSIAELEAKRTAILAEINEHGEAVRGLQGHLQKVTAELDALRIRRPVLAPCVYREDDGGYVAKDIARGLGGRGATPMDALAAAFGGLSL